MANPDDCYYNMPRSAFLPLPSAAERLRRPAAASAQLLRRASAARPLGEGRLFAPHADRGNQPLLELAERTIRSRLQAAWRSQQLLDNRFTIATGRGRCCVW